MKKIWVVCAIVLFFNNGFAFLSQGLNVEQLSEQADVIFMGEVIEVAEVTTDADLPRIRVKFKVFEYMKDKEKRGAEFSFEQFAPKVGKQFKLLGMDKNAYRVGQKLVMFMGAPGPKGLSAPEDFQLFQLQTTSSRQTDIDSAIIWNRQLSETMGNTLFENLKKTNTLSLVKQIQSRRKTVSGLQYKDFRNIIQASAE